MKKETRNVLRVIISIIYIIWGLAAPLSVIKAVIALNAHAIVTASVGVLMLLAGFLALCGMKRGKCKAFGVIIFIFAAVAVVTAVTGGAGLWELVAPIVTAVLGWLFIICV